MLLRIKVPDMTQIFNLSCQAILLKVLNDDETVLFEPS
jgi:hypothetical protein